MISDLQFRQYAREAGHPIDNILLVTPNENLTQQHLEEMAEADIHCTRFSLEGSGLSESRPGMVRIIKITKLVSENHPFYFCTGENSTFVPLPTSGTFIVATVSQLREA